MGRNNHQKLPTPIQLISSSHFLKFVTKILLPFSVLSVVLSYPLLYNFHILAHGLQLLRFSVGKNYMFLFCNGLLVFIATSSGLLGSFSVETDFKAKKTPKSKGGSQREFRVESSKQKGSITKAKVTPEVDHESQQSKMEFSAPPVQGRKDVPLVVQDDEEEETQVLVSVEEHEDEDEGLGLMSNEELNKKCEEFIRRMKEGIQFEARN